MWSHLVEEFGKYSLMFIYLSQVYHKATVVEMMKKLLSRSIFSCEHEYHNK